MKNLLFILFFCPLPALANLCEDKAFSIRSVGSVVADVANRVSTKTSKLLKKDTNGIGPVSPSVQIIDPNVMGVEAYSSALLRETKLLLNRNISNQEIEAIEQASFLKKKEGVQTSEVAHKSGLKIHSSDLPDRRKKHPLSHPFHNQFGLRAKAQILKKAGFSQQEIRKLMESGIVWTRNMNSEEALLKTLRERKENRYFRSGFSMIGDPSRILKVEKETNEHFEVLAEVLDNGILTTEKVIIPKNPKESINPLRLIHLADAQMLFVAHKSQKPKVSREDIKLPPPTHEETRLKQEGFGPAWTKGLDKLNEWVALRKQLRDLKANPRVTHIQYFADQIETYLAFAKAGLGTNISQPQKKSLAYLTKEAKKAILKEKVTYQWWLYFTFLISQLLSDKQKTISSFDLLNDFLIVSSVAQFPLRMAVPTLIKEELGIITLNLAQSEGVFPLGLVSSIKEVKGQFKDPYEFIQHDLLHMDRNLFIQPDFIGQKLKHKKILELMANLPTKKRKQAELVYFALTHEQISNVLFENKPRQAILDEISSHFNNLLNFELLSPKMAGLGKEYSAIKSKEDQTQYIKEHIIEDFMREVYDPAF